ncbi:hypothetical protein [Pyxidicoccus caerfyrddinensis]|nr:hypothetical protein [Pyxidicoccus caerfyrddinensis]
MGPWSGTAVFGVLGLDQTSGRYNVIWLDGTCDSTYYTVQEGSICIRDIH